MRWDAAGYDGRFSVITDLGGGVLELLEAHAGERILDVGCGTGRQAAELASAGCVVTGVDTDPAMIERAASLYEGRDRLDFVVGDGQRLADAVVGPFDAVLSNAAIHWMPDHDAVLRGVRAVLRDGGRFVAELGGPRNVETVIEVTQAARAELGLPPGTVPWHFPDVGEFATRLEQHRLRPDLLVRFDRPTPFSPGDGVAAWLGMFGAGLLDGIPVDSRADFDAAADRLGAEAGLLRTGSDGIPLLIADYVRLRITATAI